MKCPKCNIENREEAKYCLNCGEKLALKCYHCGRILPLQTKFCDECGNSFIVNSEIKDMTFNLNLSLKEARYEFEKAFIEIKLRELKGNISETAKAIGIERSNLHKKIKAFGLKVNLY